LSLGSVATAEELLLLAELELTAATELLLVELELLLAKELELTAIAELLDKESISDEDEASDEEETSEEYKSSEEDDGFSSSVLFLLEQAKTRREPKTAKSKEFFIIPPIDNINIENAYLKVWRCKKHLFLLSFLPLIRGNIRGIFVFR
jgi:hypothetical protein